jgi:hypothetical protein
MRYSARKQPPAWLLVALSLALLVFPFWFTSTANRPAGAAVPAAWDCGNVDAVNVAFKAVNWSGDSSALGTSLPNGYTGGIAADSQSRYFHLWLYDGSGRDTDYYLAFDSIPVSDPGPNGMYQGRIHITGAPFLSYHDGQVKVFYAQWRGPGGGTPDLFRLNTGCVLR